MQTQTYPQREFLSLTLPETKKRFCLCFCRWIWPFFSPHLWIFAGLPASAFNKEGMRTGVRMTTSVRGGRADPAASGAAARFTGVLAELHPVALGLRARLPRGGHDATVGATGSSGQQAWDGVGWRQAAAGKGGREPLQAALHRTRS